MVMMLYVKGPKGNGIIIESLSDAENVEKREQTPTSREQ
jgi:hypothetical protein